MSVDYDFWQALWDEWSTKYLADCRAMGVQAGLSDFQVWCDEQSLVPDDEIYNV